MTVVEPHRTRTRTLVRTVLALAWFGVALPALGCSSSSVTDPCAGSACNSGRPPGVVHGVRSDGRVDVTAAEAWPNRKAEPAPLTAAEIARACAVVGACIPTTGPAASKDADLATITALCAVPDAQEERAIPASGSNERWSYTLRRVLAAPSCDTVNAVVSKRPTAIVCEEDGCWWASTTQLIPKVTCAGTVATMTTGSSTYVRDCAAAYAACDPTSSTGCTDRAPVACDAKGKDRCDGDVKLGCDNTGRVSFHDCALVGRTCVETSDGASCAPKTATPCDALSSCGGGGSTQLTICAADQKVTVDCAAIGFTSCVVGHCAK